MEKKIYELTIDEDAELPMDYIALVDSPAIESNWLAFSKLQKPTKLKFQVQDEDKRIVSGFFMKADLPIVRWDSENEEEFYVVFRKETIQKIVMKFMEQGANANVNLMHDPRRIADGVFVFESLIIDKERGITVPNGFEDAPDGSWWGSMKVDNDEIWSQVKDGTFRGFSIEGMFQQSRVKSVEQEIIEKVRDLLKDLK